MAEFRVQYFSDSMLKHLDSAFKDIGYAGPVNMTCVPGSEISKVPELAKSCEKGSDLIVINSGINNLQNFYSVRNCMYLYEQAHKEIADLHPTSDVAFTSISYVANSMYDGSDRSDEINPLVSELNAALRSYCDNHEYAHFIDLRPYLCSLSSTKTDRWNLAADGLHYSKRGIRSVAKALQRCVAERPTQLMRKLETVNLGQIYQKQL